MPESPTIAVSDFLRGREAGEERRFLGTEAELLELIAAAWPKRTPGHGFTDLDACVVVPLPAERLVSDTVRIDDGLLLHAEVHRRQPFEDPFVRVFTDGGTPEPVGYAAAVLYSAERLEQNGGERSSGAAWEVVKLIADASDDVPMDPLTMARNFLGKPGGSPMEVTAREFAEAIYHWSMRAKRRSPT